MRHLTLIHNSEQPSPTALGGFGAGKDRTSISRLTVTLCQLSYCPETAVAINQAFRVLGMTWARWVPKVN